MLSVDSSAVIARPGVPARTREGRVVTWILIAFLAWIPLQTPVALLAWQYLHVSVQVAQGILLTKDLWAAVLFLILLARHWRDVRFRWFDWLAVVYGGLVLVYSVVPPALGSHLPALSVIASARELLVPVELYGLGRLAQYSGVSTIGVVKGFLVIAGAAALFTVGAFFLLPNTFWNSTYNLVLFIHDVQGVTTATDLWWASLLNMYIGFGPAFRAVGPFTHPVGTGVYFAMPLTLALCAVWTGDPRRRLALGIAAFALVLFAMAVITPISRGTWAGFLGAVLVCGVLLRKYRLAFLTFVIFTVFVALVPPFSYAIRTFGNGSDTSTIAHAAAVDYGLKVIAAAPAGSGVGNADQFGAIFAGGGAAGVGENMYLAVYASIGPVGFFAFVIFLGALLWELLVRRRPTIPLWISVGVGAGLLAEAAAGMTASTLMRFTNAASICLLVGLVIAAPYSESRLVNFSAVRHPRRWLESRGEQKVSEPSAD
jgi:hypothetical protein